MHAITIYYFLMILSYFDWESRVKYNTQPIPRYQDLDVVES